MHLLETTDYLSLDHLINDKQIRHLLQCSKDFKADNTYKYLAIKHQDEIIGCFFFKEFTKITIECHIILSPKYWGTGISEESVQLGHEWARLHNYVTIITTIPSNAIHTIKFMNRIKYTPVGVINNGIIYKNKLVPLIIYSYNL